MIIHDHHDALLTEELTTSSTAQEVLTSDIIDLRETGGVEHAHLILSAEAGDAPLTLNVLGAATKEGEYAPVPELSFTTTEGEDFHYRQRIPLLCPQYIKLQVSVGDTAPSEPVRATLRVAL